MILICMVVAVLGILLAIREMPIFKLKTNHV